MGSTLRFIACSLRRSWPDRLVIVQSDHTLQRLWYQGQPRWLFVLLAPLSCVFFMVIALRRSLYATGILRIKKLSVPIIVVGNVTVGGTGKTPFVIWLAMLLRKQGRKVGIVLRGYGGKSNQWPQEVHAQTSARQVGDEAVLHATRTGSIVVAGPDRVAAAELAIRLGADVVLSDDGLQHYRLARDAEICVLDRERGIGNGWMLPAGPLREPRSRTRQVDLIVLTQRGAAEDVSNEKDVQVISRQRLADAVSMASGERRSLASFATSKVHAIAGIGHPQAFFEALRAAG